MPPHPSDPSNRRRSYSLATFLLYALPVLLIATLCCVFEPSWRTNDDAAMSMIAHGYGAIAEPSPKLIFSHLYWGHIVQAIPAIGGLLGYSLAALIVMGASGVIILFLLEKSKTTTLELIIVILILLFGNVIFPQFTITAGLITIAGVAALIRYGETKHLPLLFLAIIAGILGFLIRRNEAALVFIVALPLLPWNFLIKDWRTLASGAALAAILIGLIWVDKSAYKDSEWTPYKTVLPEVVEFIAWGVGDEALNRPDLLEKHGFQPNDIKMVMNWMWFDQTIINPEQLNGLSKEIGRTNAENWLIRIGTSLKALLDQDLIYIGLFGITLVAFKPSKRLLFAWLIFITAICAFGIIGRPGIIRVYIPMLTLLAIAPFFLVNAVKHESRNRLKNLLLVGITGLHISHQSYDGIKRKAAIAKHNRKIEQLPNADFIAGYYSTFKANYVYTVKGAAKKTDSFGPLYLFGWPAPTPYSYVTEFESKDAGFGPRLLSTDGVWVLINTLDVLKTYCENRDLTFEILEEASPNTGGARRIRATSKPET